MTGKKKADEPEVVEAAPEVVEAAPVAPPKPAVKAKPAGAPANPPAAPAKPTSARVFFRFQPGVKWTYKGQTFKGDTSYPCALTKEGKLADPALQAAVDSGVAEII